MSNVAIVNATLVLPDRLETRAGLQIRDGRISACGETRTLPPWNDVTIDAGGQYVAPGFVDMHVHGGNGADFMDGDDASFAKVIAAHRRHGTTGIVPTSTVATHEQTLRFLELSQQFQRCGQILGAHLYGPFFNEDKVGCHPKSSRSARQFERSTHSTWITPIPFSQWQHVRLS